MKCLIYVTKSKPWLFFDKSINYYSLSNKKVDNDLNGKIVAEFDGEVEEIFHKKVYPNNPQRANFIKCHTKTMNTCGLLCKSMLRDIDIYEYIGNKNGWAIHIKNLEVFDKPKELKDYHISYYNKDLKMMREKYLEKAPQNMMKVYDKDGNEYILISIRPEWACKILNGEKTVEVRKQVLNCMKGN